jgi:hypothetical protein
VPDPVATSTSSTSTPAPATSVVAPASTAPTEGTAAPAVAATDGSAAVKPVGAPEKYTDFKLPDGVKLDAAEVTELQTYAKTHNLTQEQAQALVDRTVKTRGDTEAALVAKQQEAVKQLATDWKAATQADKEIGGDNLTATLATAVKARDAFGSPELIRILNDSGMGNHPEVVRFFAKVGKAMGEDKFVQGSANSGTAANPEAARAARMYPSMAQK